jgi:hypothetical protein
MADDHGCGVPVRFRITVGAYLLLSSTPGKGSDRARSKTKAHEVHLFGADFGIIVAQAQSGTNYAQYVRMRPYKEERRWYARHVSS